MNHNNLSKLSEFTLKKALWIIYAILYIALLLLGIYVMFSTNEYTLSQMLSPIFSIIYLIGLFGYIFERRVWTANVWRRFFYLICFGIVVSLLVGLISAAGQNAFDAIFGAVFSAPLMFALYQYSKGDQNYWVNAEENIHGNRISALMESIPVLEIEKQVGPASTKVQITKDSKQYIVHITRITDNKEESFQNTFTNTVPLVLFIEQYTFIKMADFESKYAS